MPKKRYNAEEIIHKLRGADVLLSRWKLSATSAIKLVSATKRAPEALTTPALDSGDVWPDLLARVGAAIDPESTPTRVEKRRVTHR